MHHLSDGEAAAFCAAWVAAEDSLKDVESELIQLPIQPINELRYATRHFARALTADSREECAKQYEAGMRHCVYASYDCAEAVLTYRILRFKAFREDFKDLPIETPVLDYRAALLAYRAAQGAIARNPEERDKRRDGIKAACKELESFDACLDAARDELNKKRILRPQTELGTARRWRGTLAVAVATTLLGGVCGFAIRAWFERSAGHQGRPDIHAATTATPTAAPPKSPP